MKRDTFRTIARNESALSGPGVCAALRLSQRLLRPGTARGSTGFKKLLMTGSLWAILRSLRRSLLCIPRVQARVRFLFIQPARPCAKDLVLGEVHRPQEAATQHTDTARCPALEGLKGSRKQSLVRWPVSLAASVQVCFTLQSSSQSFGMYSCWVQLVGLAAWRFNSLELSFSNLHKVAVYGGLSCAPAIRQFALQSALQHRLDAAEEICNPKASRRKLSPLPQSPRSARSALLKPTLG